MKYLLLLLISTTSFADFGYVDKKHSAKDILFDQSIMFSAHLLGYYLTQKEEIEENGSFRDFEDRFLEFRFDKDSSSWNLIGHPMTGSQVYLFYRARGYTSIDSFKMSFLTSLAFEVLIETYTENPGIQDMFQTPLYGSILGYMIERLSHDWLNSQSTVKKFVARVINPFSYLVDSKSKHSITVGINKQSAPMLTWSYRL